MAERAGIQVVIGMEGVGQGPRLVHGVVERAYIQPYITHQDALEALEVFVGILTHTHNAMIVAQRTTGVGDDLLCISLVLLVAIMTVEQHSGAQHGALVVGRSPRILGGHRDVVGIEHHAVEHLSRSWFKEILSLVAIQLACFLIIALVARGQSDVAGSHLSRTVHAGVGAIAVSVLLSPSQQAHIAEIGAVPDKVEVALRIVQVHLLARQQIGTDGIDDEPHHVVVVVVAPPVVAADGHTVVPIFAHMILHVVVARLMDVEQPLVACGLIHIEDGLQGLRLTPASVHEGAVALPLVLQVLLQVAVDHALAGSLVEGRQRLHFLEAPGLVATQSGPLPIVGIGDAQVLSVAIPYFI